MGSPQQAGEAEVVEGATVIPILRAAIGARGGGLFLGLGDIKAEAVQFLARSSEISTQRRHPCERR